jgi:hypothetical protein
MFAADTIRNGRGASSGQGEAPKKKQVRCRSLLGLHMWMLLSRLRKDGAQTKALQQELYDLFQEDVEVRVRQQISLRISSTLKELERNWYGEALALDKVCMKQVGCPGHCEGLMR